MLTYLLLHSQPYFDENDVQDDEGNWGRSDGSYSYGSSFSAGSNTTDLWTRQIADIPSSTEKIPVNERSELLPNSAAKPSEESTLLLMMEMNRKFERIEDLLRENEVKSAMNEDKETRDLLKQFFNTVVVLIIAQTITIIATTN